MLHILQLSIDKYVMCFNIKRCGSSKFWPLIEKMIPFYVDPRGFLKWSSLVTICIITIFQYMRLVLSVIFSS